MGTLSVFLECVFGGSVHESLNNEHNKIYEENEEEFGVETLPIAFQVDIVPSLVDIESAAIVKDILASHVKIN